MHLTHRFIGFRVKSLDGGSSVQAASVVPSHETTDLRVSVNHESGLEASIFANNICNDIGVTCIENLPLYTRKRITLPRTIGLIVGYRF